MSGLWLGAGVVLALFHAQYRMLNSFRLSLVGGDTGTPPVQGNTSFSMPHSRRYGVSRLTAWKDKHFAPIAQWLERPTHNR